MPDDIITLANSFRADLLNSERKAAIRLIDAYGKIYKRLSTELGKLTAQIAEAQKKGEVVNAAWLFRQQRYATLLAQVDAEFKKFAAVADKTITNQQDKAVNAALGDSVALMGAAAEQAGIAASFNRLPVAAVENMVGMLGNGSPLTSLLNELPRDARAIVSQGLIQGLALGRNPKAIAREIRAGLNGNLERALLVSRTETLRAYRTATHQNYQANSDVVRGWTWRSSRSRRCCAACIALDGTFHSVRDPMRPHPRCRCTLIPSTRTVQVDRGADWFNDQDAETQRAILGTNVGYEKFKRGELKLEDFVGLNRDPRWGDSYYQLSVKRAVAGQGQFPGYGAPVVNVIIPRKRLALTPAQLDLIRNAPPYIDEAGNRDSSKIAVALLGLTHSNPFPPGLKDKAQEIIVDLARIELGRPALDRQRLLILAEELAGGLTEAGLKKDPINLSQKPSGDFVVGASGNHRVALLKLMGFQGEVDAKARMQKKTRK